jgi:hypothetical protein
MLCTSWLAIPVHATNISANPTNYRTMLANLKPGDTLVLAKGTYLSGLTIRGKFGTSTSPITVLGPADKGAVFKANACCNTVQLENVAHVRIQNLTLDGAGTNGPFGVDARGSTHHVTIENLNIVKYGGNQQIVGISTKGPAWDWVIRGNRIVGAGTGMYLGQSNGTAPFVRGVIEYNTVLDTLGYNMQIKHQVARPTGIGLPTGDSRTIIRHNVWSKGSNSASGDMARPNVLVGHFPVSGMGSNDRYEIYGNFFFGNPTEALFQGEGNLVVHDNIFVNASGSAIHIQPHHDKPRAVTVYHNTVVASGEGILVYGGDSAYRQAISANSVFAGSTIFGPNQTYNVTGTYAAATNYFNAPHAPIGTLDLYPKQGKLAGMAISLTSFSAYQDGARDFNGKARVGAIRGAYEGEGANPGWKLALSRKPNVN